MKKNIRVLVIEIVVITLAVISVAFAINYVMDSIGITASTANLAVTYTGSTTLPSTSLAPVNDSQATYNTSNTSIMKVNFTVKGAAGNPNKPIIYDVILDDLNMRCYLKNEYLKWKLFKNGTQLTTGNFSPTFDVMKDNKLFLTTIQQDLPSSSATADSYQLLVWISESCTASNITTCTESQDQSQMLGETISGKVQTVLYTNSKKSLTRSTGSITCPNKDKSGANPPALVDGLIPVTYNVTNGWVKADVNNIGGSWYNYEEKHWANAVLVTSSNRSAYKSANAGTPIPEADVLAYYVWIPRYKYKVWNVTKTIGVDSYDAEHTGIDIKFENGKATTGTISCIYNFNVDSANGGIDLNNTTAEICTCGNHNCTNADNGFSYYTHPAFTFGEDELDGIWVGKFELSSETPDLMSDGIYYGGGFSDSLTVRIKPNVRAWQYNNVSNFYKVIYDMQKNNNIYGLSTDRTKTDSHMLKNIDWGAVAYLTNSKYGRCNNNVCTEVTKNNSSDLITGNAGNTIIDSVSAGVTNVYNSTLGQLASTTGNIYGIYDLSGGAWEYLMGGKSSSLVEYVYNNANASNFVYNVLTSKYIDRYAAGDNRLSQFSINRARLGDAVSEVILTNSSYGSWYLDNNSFYSSLWIARGGWSGSGTNSGLFNIGSDDGDKHVNATTRAVLVSLK